MRQLFFAVILSGGAVVSSIFVRYSASMWMGKSGLVDLSTHLVDYCNAAIVISVLSLLLTAIMWQRKSEFICILQSFLYGTVACAELYVGFLLFSEPKAFLASFAWKWEDNLGSRQVERIEKRFKCCDFIKPGQFNRTSAACKLRHPHGCLSALHGQLSDVIQNTGLAILGEFIAHLSCIVILWVDLNRRDGKPYPILNTMEENNGQIEAFIRERK